MLVFTSPNLSITGEYQRQEYSSQSHGINVSITLPQFAAAAAIANTALGTVLDRVLPNQAATGGSSGGRMGLGISYNGSFSHDNSGQYFLSNISSPSLTITSGNQHIDGANINGQIINPSGNTDYQDSGSNSFGFGVGTGGVNASVGFGDLSFGAGVGSGGLFGSVGYGNFNLGTSFRPGDNHLSIFGGGYGVLGSVGFTPIANHPNLFDFGATYGPTGIGGSIGNGQVNINANAGFWSTNLIDYASQGSQIPVSENLDRTTLINETLIAVDKVRNTYNLNSEQIETLNLIEQLLQNAKTLELVYGTSNSRQVSNAIVADSTNRLNEFVPARLPQAALEEMRLSAGRLRLEAFHDTYGLLSNIPIAGIAFGAIDSFVYANQGTAYPDLRNVGIVNQRNYHSVINGVLSSLPLPGGRLVGEVVSKTIKGTLKKIGLPVVGKIRFIPRYGWNPSQSLRRGPQNGFLDKFGNEWIWDPIKAEWDVQLSRIGKNHLGIYSRSGSHINVSPDGRITH